MITKTIQNNQIRIRVFEDMKEFQKQIELLEIKRKFQKVNSCIRYKHSFRREKIIKLANMGKTQKEIAEKMNCSYSTVKREIKAIREGLA